MHFYKKKRFFFDIFFFEKFKKNRNIEKIHFPLTDL